jgi:hypothetical protein
MERYELNVESKQIGRCAYQHKVYIKGCADESSALDFAMAWAKEARIVFQRLMPTKVGDDFVVYVIQDSGD